jgi:hypothetical protein
VEAPLGFLGAILPPRQSYRRSKGGDSEINRFVSTAIPQVIESIEERAKQAPHDYVIPEPITEQPASIRGEMREYQVCILGPTDGANRWCLLTCTCCTTMFSDRMCYAVDMEKLTYCCEARATANHCKLHSSWPRYESSS